MGPHDGDDGATIALEEAILERLPAGVPLSLRPGALAAAAAVRRRYAGTFGPDRRWQPRRQSDVLRRVDVPVDVAVARLRQGLTVEVRAGLLRTFPSRGAVLDRVNHERRVPAALRVRWSWPELPMWLGVAEFSASTSVLRLCLRRHGRLRYPRRYYHAAHAALDAVAARVEDDPWDVPRRPVVTL